MNSFERPLDLVEELFPSEESIDSIRESKPGFITPETHPHATPSEIRRSYETDTYETGPDTVPTVDDLVLVSKIGRFIRRQK
ncbi:MAG TPA: hypothetical protein VLF39_01835 [Candidatus Saccharimonadales bacterium]|nr:hypothetical protein [Candidatus Saccharimonadales bacterium]